MIVRRATDVWKLWIGYAAFVFILGGTTSAKAEGDITLQLGKKFSIFASGNCEKTLVANVDLALVCDFRGLKAEFYLKEERASLNLSEFPAEYFPFTERLLRSVLRDVGASNLNDRIKLGGGARRANPRQVIVARSGFLYKNSTFSESEIERRVILSYHSLLGEGAAALFVLSDLKRDALRELNQGVPQEVITMVKSLDYTDNAGRNLLP